MLVIPEYQLQQVAGWINNLIKEQEISAQVSIARHESMV